jgi:hypothetical protein
MRMSGVVGDLDAEPWKGTQTNWSAPDVIGLLLVETNINEQVGPHVHTPTQDFTKWRLLAVGCLLLNVGCWVLVVVR